jgi:hypothetical protein
VTGFANYLQAHNRVRATALAVSFVIASVALSTGIGVYALTLGPKAVGDYIRDRFMAGGLIAVAMLLDLGTASVLAQRGGRFFSRLLISVLVTVGGAIMVFGLIVARAVLVKSLSAY